MCSFQKLVNIFSYVLIFFLPNLNFFCYDSSDFFISRQFSNFFFNSFTFSVRCFVCIRSENGILIQSQDNHISSTTSVPHSSSASLDVNDLTGSTSLGNECVTDNETKADQTSGINDYTVHFSKARSESLENCVLISHPDRMSNHVANQNGGPHCPAAGLMKR